MDKVTYDEFKKLVNESIKDMDDGDDDELKNWILGLADTIERIYD